MMNLIFAVIAAVIITGDRLSKMWVMNNVTLGERFCGIDGFIGFLYAQNKGAAFSLMSGKLGLLSIISVLFCVAVVVYWIVKKPSNKLFCTALMLMTAGAAGNGFDRIAYGYVVDFIATEFIDFPVFNIADIAITVGAGLLVLYAILFDEGKEKK